MLNVCLRGHIHFVSRLSFPERREGNVVTKIAIRRCKDFVGAQGFRRPGSFVWEGGDYAVVVVVVVCPLRCELVSAPLSYRRETFGGGRGWCQARLSPEPFRSVEVWPKKYGKFEFLRWRRYVEAAVLAEWRPILVARW